MTYPVEPGWDWQLHGEVRRGRGEAAGFIRRAWVAGALRRDYGIEPWPGTLNLVVREPADRQALAGLQGAAGTRLPAGEPGACDARCYPVRLAGRCPAVVVVPEVAGYPADQLECVAAVDLRAHLGLADGDRLACGAAHRPGPPRAVIFDVDGTLVNSVDAYHVAAGRAAAPHGFSVSRAQVRAALNQRLGFWDLVLPPDRRSDAALLAELRTATRRHWPDVLASHVRVFPGLADTLAGLRRAGVALGIYTGSRGESFAPLEQAGLLAQFEVVVTAAEVTAPKPHPEGLQRCAEALGIAPAEAAYVGDAADDMAAALAAGMLAVGLLSGAGDSAGLSAAGAHRLAPDHRALPGILGLA